VTDASLRGARVAGAILEVIERDVTVRPTRASLVINRFNGEDALIVKHAREWGLEILGRIPDDRNITEYDVVGRPLTDLPEDSPSVMAVKEICERILEQI
jgi:CO dehydrogenase maturation factor